MAPSNADRPYGSFRRLEQEEAVDRRAASRGVRIRRRLGELRARTHGAQIVAISVTVALALFGAASALAPVPPRLTDADLNKAIKDALASATPKPNVAIAAYDKVKESVVQVKTRSAADPGMRPRGAGILIDSGGMIITSLHLLRESTEIVVVFFDGQEVPAIVADAQPEFDVALLHTTASGRRPAVLASAKSLRVGDEAIIVGSPLGLGTALSVGTVSRLGSFVEPSWGGPRLGGLIQFNAAVYPGNSGGPLVNRRGEVIGIVIVGTMDLSGVGFAVPIDSAASAAGGNPF